MWKPGGGGALGKRVNGLGFNWRVCGRGTSDL